MSIEIPVIDIEFYRKKIQCEIISYFNNEKQFSFLDKNHIKLLYELYDKFFLNNECEKLIKEKKYKLEFKVGYGKKRIGYCKRLDRQTYLISISNMLTKLNFNNKLNINGIDVDNRLDALLILFEHELIHLYMFLKGWYDIKDKYYLPHGKLFKTLVRRLFGHTKVRHQLDENKQIKNKNDFNLKQKVCFDYKKAKKSGIIIKLNPKRAKILLDNNIIMLVPYSLLT